LLLIKLPDLSSNQNAAVAVWPAGRIAALSFKETPTTLLRKFCARLISSPIVVVSRFFGDICPEFPSTPTDVTVVSSVQYQARPVNWSTHSLPTIPCIAGIEPVYIVACPTAVADGK